MIRLVRTKAKDGKNGKKICQNFLNCKPREVKKFAVLHHFADASQFTFGAVLYLRMVDSRDHAYCSFLMGKSRLVHIKPMTVPRLELSAAVLAVQLDDTLQSELEIPLHQSVFWTDSTTVL